MLSGVIITLLSAIISILVALVGWVIKQVISHGDRIAIIETKVDPLWDAVRDNVTEFLKHPDDENKDILLTKLKDYKITLEELWRLKNILLHEIPERRHDVGAYALVLALINQEIKLKTPRVKRGKNNVNNCN